MRGDIPFLLKRTGAINADEFELVTDMFMSRVTSGAITAMIEGPHNNVLARFKICDALTNRRNHA